MDPCYPSFLAQEDSLLTIGGLFRERPENFRILFVSGMHKNPCKSLQECEDGNLDNVFTAQNIFSCVAWQASTRIQPTDPNDLAEKWGIGLEAANRTFECKTYRGVLTVLHPSLSRCFPMNDRNLRYRRLRPDVFGDTLLPRTKSKRSNKDAEVFVTKFGWSRTFPMDKKGYAHEALYLLFQQYRVPPKMIVDGLTNHTLGDFKPKVIEDGCHLRQTEP